MSETKRCRACRRDLSLDAFPVDGRGGLGRFHTCWECEPKGTCHRALAARIAANTDKSGDCWEWTGTRNNNGYGVIRIQRKMIGAHRVAYELAFGAFDKALFVCHRCDNPTCVRPDHLFLGTLSDNAADMCRKGRQAKGERNGHASLTDKKVVEIRALYKHGITVPELAAVYGSTRSAVGHAVKGRTWRHLLAEGSEE